MRWAVVGSTGMFGTDLVQVLRQNGETVAEYSRPNFDLELDEQSLARLIGSCDILVNCVAFTAVDLAETRLEEAMKVNADYAEKLGKVASFLGANYYYISTDYVFSGEKATAYTIGDIQSPRTAYGISKAEGEMRVRAIGGNYTIFRTSWLYGQNGKCFPKAIAAKLLSTGTAEVVNDQYGSPTWTVDLAAVLMNHGLSSSAERVVHAVASGSTSWFEFAVEIAKSIGISNASVKAMSSHDYRSVARRPQNSVLDNREYQGLVIGDWRERWRVASSSVLDH